MHRRFALKWCETLFNLMDTVGYAEAAKLVKATVGASEWDQIRTTFPEYLNIRRGAIESPKRN